MAVLSDAQLADLVRRHWGDRPPFEQETAFAIALAESGGNTLDHNTAGEDSRGLWQINVAPGANPQFLSWDLYDPDTNAAAARILYDRWSGWCAWSTYDGACGPQHSATYLAYLPRAHAALAALQPPPVCPPGTTGTPPACVPAAPPPTLVSVVICVDGQTQIEYRDTLSDGLATYLAVSPNAYFAPRTAFLGPFTSTGSVRWTPPAAGDWYASLNRYAFVGNVVRDLVATLACGASPPVCPPGTTGTWPACVPVSVTPPAAAGVSVLPALLLAAAAAGAVVYGRRSGVRLRPPYDAAAAARAFPAAGAPWQRWTGRRRLKGGARGDP